MAKTKVMLQPPIEVTAAATQPSKDALCVGGAKTALVVLDCYERSITSVTIEIEFNADVDSTPFAPDSGEGWYSLSTAISFTVTTSGSAVQYAAISEPLPSLMRWKITDWAGTRLTFALSVFLYDT